MTELHSADRNINGSTIFYAILACLVIGGPLLGMMGFAMLATMTLLLITSPLLLLFSPIIVPAFLVITATMIGFGAAIATAYMGMSALSSSLSPIVGAVQTVGKIQRMVGRIVGMVNERDAEEKGKAGGGEFGDYLRNFQPQTNRVARAS